MMPGSKLSVAGMNLFDLCDQLSSNVLMPLGGLLIVLFTGWVFSPVKFRNEFTSNLQYGVKIFPLIRFLIKFVIPVPEQDRTALINATCGGIRRRPRP